jgi:uncharacterized protein
VNRASQALVVVALVLVAQEYGGDAPQFYALFPNGDRFSAMSWWAGSKVLGYLVVPLLVLAAWRVRGFGLGWGETGRHWKIYVALYLIVLPVVWLASRTPAFSSVYPFYRGPRQLEWELLYGATFVSLEFFFRGFALFTLEPVMGRIAIFVMMIPYTMIHFGKPLPEVVGAVAAGVVLGHLALRTRSIWGGTAVHLAVAWTMDALALYRSQ